MSFNKRIPLYTLAFMVMLALISAFARPEPALAAARDPGAVPADVFIINDDYLRSTWPQGNLRRSGTQSPQWKPLPSDPKSFSSTQQFSAYGGSAGLWIYVNAGKAWEKTPRDAASLKENTLNFIKGNRSTADKLEFIKDCSGKGHPLVFHYRSTEDRGTGMVSFHEGFSGYAKGYFIMFFFKGSTKPQYLPPPQWLEGLFFKWLESIPALDTAGPGGIMGNSGGPIGGERSMAASAAAGAAMGIGLLLQRLLGGGRMPMTGGAEARGTGESEDRRRQGYHYRVSTTAHRRRLRADGKDSLWVYARVESDDPGANTHEMTINISFSGGGACGHWLCIGGVQFTGGYAAVQVTASPPGREGVPQGLAHASVVARAASPEGTASGILGLELEPASALRIETRTYRDRTALRPDGRDGIWLYASVAADGEADEGSLQKANESLSFRPSGEGAGWVLLGDPQYTGGWKAVYVQAAGPHSAGVSGAGHAPPGVTVAITGIAPEGELRAEKYFELLPVPDLEAHPERAEFIPGQYGPVDIKVSVSNPGAESWDFLAEPDQSQGLVAEASVRQQGPASAIISLTLSGAQADTGPGQAGFRRGTLRVTARQNDIELQKDVSLLLAVEGIEIEHRTYPDRQFRLPADGKSTVEIDFAVLRRDGSGDLTSDPESVKNIAFEECSGDGEVRNAIKAGGLAIAFDRVRRLNTPYGVYTFRIGREVPADGRVLPARIRAYVPGLGEEFSRTFDLGIETTDMSPGSRAWEEELQRTEEFIERFTPEGYKPNFRKILNDRKHTLGVDGLYKLRRQIWNAAQDIMLARGKSYEAEAAWQDHYIDVANWVKWLGDQSFSIVAGAMLGPGYALATCVSKDALVDALGRWNSGQSFEDYVDNRVKEVLQGIGEYAVNPDELKKSFGYTRAYGIYFCWRFMFNLSTDNDEGKPRSAAEAAWQAVKDCATTAVDSWLTNICEKEAIAKGWKKGSDDGGDSVGNDGGRAGKEPVPGGGEGRTGAEPGSRGGPEGGGDPGSKAEGDGQSKESSAERREKWEREAGERREKWERDAAERREKWERDAAERRKGH